MEKIEQLGEIAAPYNKKISFQRVVYENGFQMLRMRIQEGKRFTDMDLDVETVQQLQGVFVKWLVDQAETENVLE